ncbi:hypothetical protein BGZ76_001208 [Entomortierella beljakovae]|nr:hypothetical protein BGZ76_001208 [Entomortierella beljakovae]
MDTYDKLQYHSAEEIKQAVSSSRSTFKSGITTSLEFRRKQLEQLWLLLEENTEAICDALQKDCKKSRMEAICTEIITSKEEINYALDNLKSWAKPKRIIPTLMNLFTTTCYKRMEPKGSVLIISPWNYPIQLNIVPLCGAIAAGCTVVIKPSELAPHTAKLITDLFSRYLDQGAYKAINGGTEESTLLLEYQWDHIFYTGSGRIGRVVMQAAAKHLTPVTLELGGKSPVFVDEEADIEMAALRIAFGKAINAGQTCIAPDYVLMTEETEKKFIPAYQKAVTKMMGSNPKESLDYPRISNSRHFNRLVTLLSGRESGEIVIGGETYEKELYFAPTVVTNVSRQDKLLQEEIFGPILPVVRVSDVDDAIEFINYKDDSLAFYIFSTNKKLIQKILNSTKSGGVCVNDTLMHAADVKLPFGGVGSSGFGSYHGKASFDIFTHERSIMIKGFGRLPEFAQSVRYAPYTNTNLKIIRIVAETVPSFRKSFFAKYWRWISLISVAVVVVVVVLLI